MEGRIEAGSSPLGQRRGFWGVDRAALCAEHHRTPTGGEAASRSVCVCSETRPTFIFCPRNAGLNSEQGLEWIGELWSKKKKKNKIRDSYLDFVHESVLVLECAAHGGGERCRSDGAPPPDACCCAPEPRASRARLELPEPGGGGLQLPGASLHLGGGSPGNLGPARPHHASRARPELSPSPGKRRTPHLHHLKLDWNS